MTRVLTNPGRLVVFNWTMAVLLVASLQSVSGLIGFMYSPDTLYGSTSKNPKTRINKINLCRPEIGRSAHFLAKKCGSRVKRVAGELP